MRLSKHNRLQEAHWDKIAKIPPLKDKEIPYPALKEMREFFEFLNLKKKSRILEIGCGAGRYTLPLLESGHYILGTDLSKKSLNSLQKQALARKLSKNLTLAQNSFEKDTLSQSQKYSEKFDLALMVAVIHHFNPQKREKIFKNIVRSVKKKGLVVALEPNPFNPFYYLLYFWRWLNNSPNVNRWTTEKGMLYAHSHNLKQLFQKFGLQNIQIKRYAFLPSTFGNRFKIVLLFNDLLTRIPIIKEFSAFVWIKGRKTNNSI